MTIEIRGETNNEAIATLNRVDAIDALKRAVEMGADLSTLHLYDQDRERISADEIGVDFSVSEATVLEPEKVLEIIQNCI